MTLEELRARLAAIEGELRSIDGAAGQGDLSETAQTRWSELMTEHASVEQDIAAEERAGRVRDSRSRWQSTQITPANPDVDSRDANSLTRMEARDRLARHLDDRAVSGSVSAESRERVLRLAEIQTQDFDGERFARYAVATLREEYRNAFMQATARGSAAVLLQDEVRAVREVQRAERAMSIGTTTQGGFALPVIIDPTVLLTSQGTPNVILDNCRVEQITNDAWRGLSSAGVTWKFRAEATASTDGSPAIAQPIVHTQRADGTIVFSVEIEGDWQGFATQMASLFGEGYSEILVSKLTNGSATSNEPVGMITNLNAAASGAWIEVTTAGALGSADVYGLWANLPIRWRSRARFMSSTGIENTVRRFASGGGQDPNFSVNITQAEIGRLFGREYLENDYMQTSMPAGTGTQGLLVVGDFQQYLVAQRVGMSIELIPHVLDATTGYPTGQRMYFAWARVGGDVLVSQAFKLLRNRSA